MERLLLISVFCFAEGYLNDGLLSVSITRHHKGDVFKARGEKCYKDLCVSLSGGTAAPTGNGECECKCGTDRPVFRDDLNTCVEDIQECSLVPFASGSVIKKIPYVFLPLRGQIVYPSADVLISGMKTSVCVVSGSQFLGQNGWVDLRNDSGLEVPFTLYQDEGRTYLQWLGESSLRMALEGRIILVHLLCKGAGAAEEPEIFTPCIAFRVAGNPSVKEMMFATDVHLKEEYGGGLTAREYIAIGICSLLLAVVYVAAVFLYLHVRKRKHKGNKKKGEDARLTLGEEGVIKSNPLLQASRHLSVGGHDNAGYVSESNSCCSDTDQTSDLVQLDDEDLPGLQNMQTSAIIHPCELDCGDAVMNQEPSNIEKLPEENVSIVETLEAKETHPETVRVMGCANGRKKLYFNPSYFEPDLLKAPPPAAVEFLIKIREVIAIAKHKMSAKKFSPSLLGIPEEEGSTKTGCSSSALEGLRKEPPESRETRKPSRLEKTSPELFHLLPNELCWPSDAKQKIIRKWLEDVPVMVLHTEDQENKTSNKSKPWGTPTPPARQEKRKTKGRAPPVPPLKNETNLEPRAVRRDSFQGVSENAPPRPPPMPTFKRTSDDVPRVQGKDCVPPAISKNLMDAVIQELTSYRNGKLKELLGSGEEGASGKPPEGQSPREEDAPVGREAKPGGGGSPQDDHEYEVILLTAEPPPGGEVKELKIYDLPEILCKSDKAEGYSLVSEVYVNDGYSCCSGESPPSSTCSSGSVESDKVHYDTPNEQPGRLTIHVNDSPERYRNSASESENFEPDTLDRKPRRRTGESERYSNQKFHEMEFHSNKSENFVDSLERPSILLKTSGTFKRNSLEREIDDLFRNFGGWRNPEGVGSLREIFEAKSKSYGRGAETRSLIAMDTAPDHDRLSTLSWSEERRNKLLHRGIILHIGEREGGRKHKGLRGGHSHKPPARPPKPIPAPRSRSASPGGRSDCASPSSAFPLSSRSTSPPPPPPRSLPASPPPRSSSSPLHPQPRSTTNSPVHRNWRRSPSHSPSSSLLRSTPPSSSSPTPPHSAYLSSPPPPRPPKPQDGTPSRNTKPPLPPKSGKRYPKTGKFAGRPLPPLPRSPLNLSPSPLPFKDPEALSTHSGASADSLNSSDYEAFYTLPYEEDENAAKDCLMRSSPVAPSSHAGRVASNQRPRRGPGKAIPHRQEDSGYLSTDSDSCCPRLVFPPPPLPRTLEGGSQNSETEESLCDGASESGGESIATDSFFYGNFEKSSEAVPGSGGGESEVHRRPLRLSDVEVNSDTERHCIPIMRSNGGRTWT